MKMSKISLKRIIESIEAHQLDEMANLGVKKTGLAYRLWIPHHGGKSKHFLPYIKVVLTVDKTFSVSIEPPVKVLVGDASSVRGKDWKKIVEFIEINREVLLDFYQHANEPEFDDDDRFYNRIKKVL
jgi:hypothetical protein